MVAFSSYLLLLAMTLAFYASPGPATVSLVACGASFGFRRSIAYVWGLIAGAFVVILVSFAATSALVEWFGLPLWPFKVFALLYMLFVAFKIWQSDPLDVSNTRPLTLWDGLLLNTINPKAYIGAFAIITQFMGSESTPGSGWVIGTTLMVCIAMIDFGFCYLGDILLRLASKTRVFKVINKIMAAILLATIIIMSLLQ